ncbi:MAG: glycosyltransferase family 2 protein [Desulfobacteraceae bacterium]
MSNNNPRVSIGLPVYNGARWLKEALDSFLAQTFEDFELIISDNASTDKTPEICRAYAARDARIRYYRNEKNLGAAENYNRVFHLSTGEYFKWAADDDWCAPNCLEQCVEVLDSKPEVVLCYTKTTVIDENGATIPMAEDNLNLYSPNVPERFLQTLTKIKFCHNIIFGLMRRNTLAKTPLQGKYLAADRCLVAELALHGPFWEIPERLFFRRKHSGNIGTSLKDMSFYDPSLKVLFVLPEWKVLLEHWKSIRRSPHNLVMKMRLLVAVLASAYTKRMILLKQLAYAGKQIIYGSFLFRPDPGIR